MPPQACYYLDKALGLFCGRFVVALRSRLVAGDITVGARVSSPALIMVVSFLVVGGDDGVGETAGGDTRAPMADEDVRVPNTLFMICPPAGSRGMQGVGPTATRVKMIPRTPQTGCLRHTL